MTKKLRPGALVKIGLDVECQSYDFMVWADQDLMVDNPTKAYGRVVIDTSLIGLIVKTGLNCHAALLGENTVIIPIIWCVPV